jgi:hypothetical protein
MVGKPLVIDNPLVVGNPLNPGLQKKSKPKPRFMKIVTALAIITIISFSCKKEKEIPPVQNTFTVTVSGGYGGGSYNTGDTVHLFSQAISDNQIFNQWTGNDISLLNASEEWHTWFIMPARNVTFSGSTKNITTFNLQLQQIRGRDRLKPVYYYFPANHKGLVYLLHGSGGRAQQVATSFEFQQLMKDLVNDGYGIVITEAEEATLQTDLNGDGKLRWLTAPADTLNNVDYVNIKVLTDSLYNRGIADRSKPRYSIGMSNGGAYSAALSFLYKFKAGVSYCAPGGTVVAQLSSTPFQFCMARFDNNENVGPQGNADALTNSNTLTTRGVCSKYYMKERAPLYPERFARRGDISIAKSTAVFNELKNRGHLSGRNYFNGFSNALVTAAQATPASYPELVTLTTAQILFVLEQVDLSVSDHQMYSDYNRATLRFLNRQCQ